MPSVNNNDLLFAFRMRELLRPPTAWNRSLWAVSIQTVLGEVLEASRVRRDGILSESSVSDLQATASVFVGTDPGTGDANARKQLQAYLNGKTVITPGSLAAARVQIAIDDLESNYLLRWAAEIDRGLHDGLVEQSSRCIVSHLLNRGHSPEVVAERIRLAVLARGSTITTAGDLVRDLNSLALQPSSTYRAVFPVRVAPQSGKTNGKGWMSGAELVVWMKGNPSAPPGPGERVVGAVTTEVVARDHVSAAEQAAASFALVRDRATIGSRRAIQPLGYFWLSGRSEAFPIKEPKRGVEVASIGRQDQIYEVDADRGSIDRAISLLAELDHGPASAAVTSGWAAIESLAMGPAESENRVETAIRIASLVTASYPRAELTTLAYSYITSNNDQLSTDLRNAKTNRERAEKMMQRLSVAPPPTFGQVEHLAAAKRMQQLMKDPVQTIKRINRYIECALKRLYRLRNLVAHGGRTDSIVLEAGVRAAAPLVGAAFDRIHHASISHKLHPVELIARAQFRISMLDPAEPSMLTKLLE